MCNEVKETILNEMEGIEYSMCADGWTDKRQRRFMGIDAHFIKDGNHITRFLSLKTIDDEAHNAESIARAMINIIEEYGLKKENLCSMTTDSAAVMPKTASLLCTSVSPCI